MTYTVISLVDTTGRVVMTTMESDNPYRAAGKMAKATTLDKGDLQIICMIEGLPAIYTPCQSGTSAYALDIQELA